MKRRIFRSDGSLDYFSHNNSCDVASQTRCSLSLPEKPVAYNNGLLSIKYGLLWGIVAYLERQVAQQKQATILQSSP